MDSLFVDITYILRRLCLPIRGYTLGFMVPGDNVDEVGSCLRVIRSCR